ncbi:hypothetical protein PMAYCL1PPCAC_21832, partial [Pristionchus mayeri]
QTAWTELKSSEVFCNGAKGAWEIEFLDGEKEQLDNIPANAVICSGSLLTPTSAPGSATEAPAANGAAGCEACLASLTTIFSPCDGCPSGANSTKESTGKCILTLGADYNLIVDDKQQSTLTCVSSEGKWKTEAGDEAKQISARHAEKKSTEKPTWKAGSTGLVVAVAVLICAIGAGFVFIYIRKRKKITGVPKERGVTKKYDPNIVAKKHSKVRKTSKKDSKKESKKDSGNSKESVQSKVEA